MRNKLRYAILIGIISAIIATSLGVSRFLEGWEMTTWSWRVKYFAKTSPAAKTIKVILLDQASLDWGQKENGLPWPWPRQVYTAIINFCQRGGARAVAFDVIYSEPSAYGVEDDVLLGTSIHSGPPFVSTVFLSDESGRATHWPSFIRPTPFIIQAYTNNLGRMMGKTLFADRATFPIPEVATNSSLIANVRGDVDFDGVIRRANLITFFDGVPVPSLGFAVYALDKISYKDDSNSSRIVLSRRDLVFGDRTIPLDYRGCLILRYGSLKPGYDTYSAAAIIQSELQLQAGSIPKIDPSAFKDAYVLFGFSAPALLDLRTTPLKNITPGVMVHATLLDNLLTGDFLRMIPRYFLPIYILLITLAASITTVISRKVWQSLLAFLLLPVVVALSFLAYRFGLWLPMVTPLTGAIAALGISLAYSYATEGRQRAFIRKAFNHYLSPEVIEGILKNPNQLQLGGERRELTIFFSDLQGFSSISEKLSPHELTSLLNDYLTDMTDIILAEGGTLDKYEGDAIIAFWNAPLSQHDHAARGCRAAIRCQQRLHQRQDEFEKKAGVILRARIGMNTGEVVVGNMGSQKRFDYTVLGDAANLASRLEGANKAFGTTTMISESTWKQSMGQFIGRELGLLKVVGRKTPVRVYELLGLPGESAPQLIADFPIGLEKCHACLWSEALAIFEKYPDDPPSRKYAAQCRLLINGNEPTWDGVWNLTEK